MSCRLLPLMRIYYTHKILYMFVYNAICSLIYINIPIWPRATTFTLNPPDRKHTKTENENRKRNTQHKPYTSKYTRTQKHPIIIIINIIKNRRNHHQRQRRQQRQQQQQSATPIITITTTKKNHKKSDRKRQTNLEIIKAAETLKWRKESTTQRMTKAKYINSISSVYLLYFGDFCLFHCMCAYETYDFLFIFACLLLYFWCNRLHYFCFCVLYCLIFSVGSCSMFMPVFIFIFGILFLLSAFCWVHVENCIQGFYNKFIESRMFE